jgi:hypothetical protein
MMTCSLQPGEFGYMAGYMGKQNPPAILAEGFVMGCLMGLEPTTS